MKNLLVIGLLCLTFFAGQETFAQETKKSEPTLTETLEFIGGKLPSMGDELPQIRNWTKWEPIFMHKDSTKELRHAFAQGYDYFIFSGSVIEFESQWRRHREEDRGQFTGGCDIAYKIDLKDIDPSSIKSGKDNDFGYYYVKMRTTGDKKSIVSNQSKCKGQTFRYSDAETSAWTQADTKSLVSEFTLTSLDEETANKIVKALTHAAKISGGKAEPF